MIIDEITYTCRRCGSANLVKNGHNKYGNQQFRCKDCHKSGVLNPINRHTEAEKERILAAYRERPSMRGIARNTLAKWLKKSPNAAGTEGNPPAR